MSEKRFLTIIAQYNVTADQIVFASQNADESVFGKNATRSEYDYRAGQDSEEWYDVFAATLDNFEEESARAADAGKAEYYALVAELEQLERATGLYLTDHGVDCENAAHAQGTDDWWPSLLSAAKGAAGSRAEEAGQDINALLGRVVY